MTSRVLLIRLVTPPGGHVLDPFAGSGTTACAAELERVRITCIERDPGYVALTRARIAWWAQHPDGMDVVRALDALAHRRRQVDAADAKRQAVAAAGQIGLFGDAA